MKQFLVRPQEATTAARKYCYYLVLIDSAVSFSFANKAVECVMLRNFFLSASAWFHLWFSCIQKMADFTENHICNICGFKVVKYAIGTFTEFNVASIEQPVGRTQMFD